MCVIVYPGDKPAMIMGEGITVNGVWYSNRNWEFSMPIWDNELDILISDATRALEDMRYVSFAGDVQLGIHEMERMLDFLIRLQEEV